MDEMVTVCARCGSQACVGKDACEYDGYPHSGTAEVPAGKLARHLEMVATEEHRKQRGRPRKSA